MSTDGLLVNPVGRQVLDSQSLKQISKPPAATGTQQSNPLAHPAPNAMLTLARDASDQGWAKLVLIALERYSVALKRLTFNLR